MGISIDKARKIESGVIEVDNRIIDYIELQRYCEVSGKVVSSNIEPHHIKSRGAGGTNDFSNLIRLTPELHREIHTIGARKFAVKYKAKKIRDYLVDCDKWTIFDEGEFNNGGFEE